MTMSESSRNGTSSLLPYTSEVEAITTSFFFLLACFNTTSVPWTLFSIVWTGCSTISFTPTAAARWKTTSPRSMSSASSGSLLTVSMKYSNPARPLRCAMLSIEPVERLSRINTSWPWSSSVSERWDPMKPAPPVISARTRDVLSGDLQPRCERARGVGDGSHVRVRQGRIERQREDFVAGPRRDRTIRRRHARHRGLRRDRHGVVDQRLDALGVQVRLQWGARRRPYDEQMVDMAGVDLRQGMHRRVAQLSSIVGGNLPAPRDPARQPRQPRPQNRRLHLVEPRVDARLDVMIAIDLAAVPQPPQAFGKRPITGDDRAAVAERSEILGRVEAERAGDANGPHRTAGGGREVRLAAVFD